MEGLALRDSRQDADGKTLHAAPAAIRRTDAERASPAVAAIGRFSRNEQI